MKLIQTALLCFALFFFNVNILAADIKLSDVQKGLMQDIKNAQKELSETESSISKEREKLAQKINAEQNRVLELRQKAVIARRASDEETLSLRQLETRLKTWQEQSEYQRSILAGFLDHSGIRSLGNMKIDMSEDLNLLNQVFTEQKAGLYPVWHKDSIVSPEGQIEAADMLNLGPVHLFYQAEQKQSGLITREHDMYRVSLLFDREAHKGISNLYRDAAGTVTFDPTLSRALLLAEDKETIMQHLKKGGIWVIPILMFALFATITAICKAVSLFRLPPLFPALPERVAAAMKDSASALDSIMKKVQGPQKMLLEISLTAKTFEQRDESLYALLLKLRNNLERWLGAIALTASVSPLLGLLGTISGMITTFKLMTLFGSGDASLVSSGIAEALITTELGLVVAIPALIAHALMSRKVKNIFSQLEDDAVHLSQLPIGNQ